MKPQIPWINQDELDNARLVGMPCVNMSLFDHYLGLPTYENGGYTSPESPSGDSISYSPVDLSVALLQSHINGTTLHNLLEFFRTTPVRPIEEHLFLTVLTPSGNILTKSILVWKTYKPGLDLNLPLDFDLHVNCNLTFKEF